MAIQGDDRCAALGGGCCHVELDLGNKVWLPLVASVCELLVRIRKRDQLLLAPSATLKRETKLCRGSVRSLR